MFRTTSLALLALALLACSANSSSTRDNNAGSDRGSDGTGASGGSGGNEFEDEADGGDADDPGPAIATLRGRVYAPNGEIPISNALVYLTKNMPPDIPDGVYCDKCVELPSGTPHTFSAPSGEFELPVHQTGEYNLVVQKGQFRRVRSIEVVEGVQQVDKEKTTFPAKNMKPFDSIPRMAVITGQWDAIDVTLAHLGLAKTKPGFMGRLEVDRSQPVGFDYIEGMAATSFLKNPTEMAKYHIIFKPCSETENTDTGLVCKPWQADEAPVQNALREYVAKGGKFYATDYSYEYVRRTWPGFITWQSETSQTGSACSGGGSNGPAEVPDSGMGAWLSALGHKDWDIHGSWTGLQKVSAAQGLDPDGNPATITPKVWVQSKVTGKPATVSFESGCGRVMYSTYHTEENDTETTPQMMALLYVLLEVGVCVEPPVVK